MKSSHRSGYLAVHSREQNLARVLVGRKQAELTFRESVHAGVQENGVTEWSKNHVFRGLKFRLCVSMSDDPSQDLIVHDRVLQAVTHCHCISLLPEDNCLEMVGPASNRGLQQLHQ